MKKLLIPLLLTLTISSANANSFIDDITDIVGTSPEVNINLGASLIRGFLSFSDDKDAEEVSKVMEHLNKIRISVFDLHGNENTQEISNLIKSEVSDLSSNGYEQIVTVKEDNELVYIVAKVEDELLQDVMIVVMEDDDELVLISLDGQIDLKQIAQISGHFDIDLDGIVDLK